MTIGLNGFRDDRHLKLGWMVMNPFLEPEREEELAEERASSLSVHASTQGPAQR